MTATPENEVHAAPAYSAPPASSSAGEEIHLQDEKASPSPSNDAGLTGPRGTTGQATVSAYVSEDEKAARSGNYPFRWSSLWSPAVVNPVNGKSLTFPLLRVWDSYGTAFWLATLGEWALNRVRFAAFLQNVLTIVHDCLAFTPRRFLRCLLRMVRRSRLDDRR